MRKELPPTVLWEDNQGAIALAKNPVFHKRTKHIQIRYHFVRDAVDDKVIDVDFCPREEDGCRHFNQTYSQSTI